MKRRHLIALCGMICLVLIGLVCVGQADSAKVLKLPPNLVQIEDEAFSGAASVREIVLPEQLESIGAKAFAESGIGCIQLPASVTKLGEGVVDQSNGVFMTADAEQAAFFEEAGVRWLEFKLEKDHAVLKKCHGEIAEARIPATVSGLPVTEIGEGSFREIKALKKVVMPDSVEILRDSAFRDCANLTEITLSKSLTKIEDSVFRGCGSNSQTAFTLTLPDGITFFSNHILDDCPAVLVCGIESETAKSVSAKGYSFARSDRPEEQDFRYRWSYYDHVYMAGLAGYAGSESPVRLPDDCKAVDYDGLKDLQEGGLVCAQLSDTAAALSKFGLNFTFPGHEDIRYRVIENVLYVMGYAGSGTEIIIPKAEAYIKAGMEEKIRQGAFAGKDKVTKTVIPEGVTAILSDAYTNCYLLTDFTLPDTLKFIDQNAFRWCGRDAEKDPFYILLPDNLEDMVGRGGGATTFSDVNAILVCGKTSKTAALLTDRNYVYAAPGEEDFRYRYEEYSEGEGDEKVTGRRLWLVGYEGNAASVTIPSGIYGIKRFSNNTESPFWRTFHGDAFFDKAKVEKVVIPEGTVRIHSDAFTNCYLLTDITFPSTLKFIDQNAFRWCGRDSEKLPFYFVLPDNLEEIIGRGGGATTFSDVNAILVCGKTSKTAALLTDRNYVYAAPGEENFRYRYEQYTEGEGDEQVTGRRLWLVGYTGSEESVTIPTGIYGIKRYSKDTESPYWRTFYAYAFYGNETIRKVVIPEGVVFIDDSAFLGCINLTDVTFPKSLRILKNHAFELCGSNEGGIFYYMLPADIEEIAGIGGAGWESFNGCPAILVCEKDSVTAYELSRGNYNFALNGHHTDGLLYRYENREIDGVTKQRLYVYDYIGENADVIIPDDLGVYGVSRTPPGGSDTWHPAFYKNKTLKKVVIPEGVVIIQDSAFADCVLLADITLPQTLKVVKNHAFENTGTSAGRFIVQLPAGITEMQCANGAGWASFNQSAAVLVVTPGSWVAGELYETWWITYHDLGAAEAGDWLHCVKKPNDDPNFKYYGNL